MYIIIVGAGKLGSNLAKMLAERNHETVIVDDDRERLNEVPRVIDVLAVYGDATQPKTLEQLALKNPDYLIATTGRDEVNLLACVVAKKMGVKKTIARVSSQDYLEYFTRLGVDYTISPEITTAQRIEAIITIPSAVDLTVVGKGELETLEFVIKEKSKVAGKKIKDVTFHDFLVIAINREGSFVIPTGETAFQKDDRVLIISKRDAIKEAEKLFGKPAQELPDTMSMERG